MHPFLLLPFCAVRVRCCEGACNHKQLHASIHPPLTAPAHLLVNLRSPAAALVDFGVSAAAKEVDAAKLEENTRKLREAVDSVGSYNENFGVAIAVGQGIV